MYKCQWFQCKYLTTQRSQIHYHHIIPKELGGSNKDYNRIWLCPTHHSHVYILESQKGIHSKVSEHSMILCGIKQSTKGRMLEYKYINCDKHLYTLLN